MARGLRCVIVVFGVRNYCSMETALRLFFVAIVVTFLAQPALAMPAGEMYKFCKKWQDQDYDYSIPEDDVEAALCVGYIFAWASSLQMSCLRGHSDVGASIEPEQLAQAFINFAQAHPEHWKKVALSLGQRFLDKFPCE